jgi:predicted Zn-dependent protease
MASCDEISQAQVLIDELAKRNSRNTTINNIWLPVVRALINIRREKLGEAIQLLQSVLPYERAALFWPASLRGEAYLRLRLGPEAAVEYRKILDNRGQDPTSFLYPLAHLGLARAAALMGDTAKGRKAYQDFFALWKDADADLPILIEVKKEYGRLN